MKVRWETRAAMALIMILLILAISACGQVPVVDRMIDQHQDEQESHTQTETDSISNMMTIGAALGCVFAPQSCKK